MSNLAVDEKLRVQIANSDLLPLLIKFLDDEDMKIKEAAGGVLANLALSVTNHKVMVEAGVIAPLVSIFYFLLIFDLCVWCPDRHDKI